MRVQSEMKTKCTIRMEDSSTSMKSVMKKEGCGTHKSVVEMHVLGTQGLEDYRIS